MDINDELQSIISEQRREFAVAVAAESDLDLAFNLQMQEAMNASLSTQPSSSSPPFHLPDDAVFGSVSESGFAHLVADEFANFERERNDRKHVEVEMNNMRVDLNRRIHDQIFAREVFRVPEERWNKTGDHFERPYNGKGSLVTPNSETFRLYFKGLVSEEIVRDVKKTLGGLGVSICDKFDNPVFELRKPLIGG